MQKGAFLAMAVGPARASQKATGVPASVTLAQAILESGWGDSHMADAWNYFGIKAQGDEPFVKVRTREVVGGKSVYVTAKFRRFASMKDCFRAHGEFLRNNPRYAPAFQTTDAESFARAVHAAGYATDPNYGDALVAIIRENDLTQYDKGPKKPAPPMICRLQQPPLKGPVVTAIQQALARAGCNPGPIDGVFAERTEAAVRRYQKAHRIDVDGVVGPATARLLGVTLGPPVPGPTGEAGAPIAPFPGVLQLGSHGEAVEAVKRGVIRALGDSTAWTEYTAEAPGPRRTFGPDFVDTLNAYKATVGLPADGLYDRPTHLKLEQATKKGTTIPALDARAMSLLAKAVEPTELELCYPHPVGASSSVCQGPHPTAGLDGNWGIDFCAPGGTPVFAVEKGVIVKLSGHSPTEVIDPKLGIFGWNIYYTTPDGYRYFSSHYGTKKCAVGQEVEPGTLLGEVGHWPGDPGRSHTHLGVTSPKSVSDAKARIVAVSKAPRLPLR